MRLNESADLPFAVCEFGWNEKLSHAAIFMPIRPWLQPAMTRFDPMTLSKGRQ